MFVAAIIIVAGSASGLGSLVASYPGPGSVNIWGIGYIDASYMAVTPYTPIYVYRLWRTTGSTASSFPVPSDQIAGCDCGVIGGKGYIWVCTGSRVYQTDGNTGSVYTSWWTPDPHCIGVAFRAEGPNYYVILTSAFLNSHLYQCSTTGSVYNSYTLSFEPSDIAYDEARGCYWVGDTSNNLIRRITYTGSTIVSFSVPYSPLGLGYEPGRNYVWVGRDDVNYINLYETASVSVEPSSMGKIKAIFR